MRSCAAKSAKVQTLQRARDPARLRDRNDPVQAWLPPEWDEWPAALRARTAEPEQQIDWMAGWLLRRWLAVRPRWDRPSLDWLISPVPIYAVTATKVHPVKTGLFLDFVQKALKGFGIAD